MKVIASKRGYFGRLIEAGETFEVPDDAQASWFKPHVEDVPEPAPEPDQEQPAASSRGRKKAAEPVEDTP